MAKWDLPSGGATPQVAPVGRLAQLTLAAR